MSPTRRQAYPPVTMGGPNDDRVRVRFPTLELFALRSSGAFRTSARRLTTGERDAACKIFKSSLELEPVRIIVSPATAAPFTLGNNIRSRSSRLPLRTVIHELTHVWQYQTQGMKYVSDSVFHQGKSFLSTGSRLGAYAAKLVPNKSFHSYTAEQQATLVEQFFAYPQLRKNPHYKKLIDELRQSRPISANVRRRIVMEEIAYGSGQQASRVPLGGRQFRVKGTPAVSLIRLEF